MKIQELFVRDIFRSINGVVKADQTDEASVWQELDEFVVTNELDRHLRDFFGWYAEAWDRIKKPDPGAKIGIWISGFFGSGKSHLLKVISYLLRNGTHSFEKDSRKAVQFFETKIRDPLLFADIKKAVSEETDVILFNIDAKADHRSSRDIILRVFLKVLNELQGFSGDHPHIAHMERHLTAKGKLETFKQAYKSHTGLDWEKERDAYLFNRDEVVKAFMEALGQSQAAAEKWIDGAEENFAISIENFCRWTRDYLDSRGPTRRLVFLVDEIGQFIGQESKLMLNLQSIVESLGVACSGRAWVVVTSQEDMDSILNEMNKSKKEDFSKIQGRFKPPLSLSSANVDEVIQARLLSKNESVVKELKEIYRRHGDILKNQLSFKACKMTFRQFKDEEDFSRTYPFAPYQFQLVQKVFEAIRKAGATGMNLARGERSMLDAFQSAAKTASNKDVGVLVPLYDFYPSIQGFLDTSVKKTIDQASSVVTLKPFDIKLLQVLFLVRYVVEFQGNVDNFVTLCLDTIDADRLKLRRTIEESLGRLENESLISRNGDLYSFLTNEERDINREIKLVELSSGEDSKTLGELIFREIYKDSKKHRYSVNKMDFDFNRLIDGFHHGNPKDGYLTLNILSPLGDTYENFDRGRLTLASADNQGEIWIRLGNDEALGKEIRTYLQTNRYVTRKNDGSLPDTTKRIVESIAHDNHNRYERLLLMVRDMLANADYCVAGTLLKLKTTDPVDALSESFEYLIQNTFPKMNYLKRLLPDPLKELQSILRSNDVSLLNSVENNPEAMEDLRSTLNFYSVKSTPMILSDLLDKRALRPYGWLEGEVLVLLGRLLVLGEIQLIIDSAPVPNEKAYEAFTNNAKRKKIIIKKRILTNPKLIQDARLLGKELFGEMGPDGEDGVTQFWKTKLGEWQSQLGNFKSMVETGAYPGKQEIDDALVLTGNLLRGNDTEKFIERLTAVKKDLQDLSDNYKELHDFFFSQRPTFDKLRSSFQRFKLNQSNLEEDDDATKALRRMQEILAAKHPYGMIKEADALIKRVEAVNSKLLEDARNHVTSVTKGILATLEKDLVSAKVPESLAATWCSPISKIVDQIKQQESVGNIEGLEKQAKLSQEKALKSFEEWRKSIIDPPPKLKTTHIEKLSAHLQSNPLETLDQVHAFLASLRQSLEKAIQENKRIEIRE